MNGIMVVPSGGWTFPKNGRLDAEINSDADLHQEPGYAELVKWLTGYRISNGREVGEPAHDINQFISRRNPRQRGDVPPAPAYAPTTVVPKNFREQVTNWLADKFNDAKQGTLAFVDEEESERRAAICVACPQNQAWAQGCPPCIENAERVITLLSRNHQTAKHGQLKACAVAHQSNQVAVTLDMKHLKYDSSVNSQLPHFCWMHPAE